MESKDALNWSRCRMMAYTCTALYIGIIRILSYGFPKLRDLIQRYQTGDTRKPALIICLISSILFESILIGFYIFVFDGLNRGRSDALIILAYYPAFVLAGWLSLLSKAGYESKES